MWCKILYRRKTNDSIFVICLPCLCIHNRMNVPVPNYVNFVYSFPMRGVWVSLLQRVREREGEREGENGRERVLERTKELETLKDAAIYVRKGPTTKVSISCNKVAFVQLPCHFRMISFNIIQSVRPPCHFSCIKTKNTNCQLDKKHYLKNMIIKYYWFLYLIKNIKEGSSMDIKAFRDKYI